MAITMQDIQEVGFEHSLRGYDVEQVDVFLERVANEVDAMNKQIAELEEKLEAKKAELDGANKELEELKAAVAEKEAAEPEQPTLHEQEIQAQLDVARERAEVEARRAEEAEGKIAKLQEQLEEKNKLDNAISEAFIAAQRSADQIKEEARIEADRIRKEAEEQAHETMRESVESKAEIDGDAQALHASARKFRDEYLDLLNRFMNDAKQAFANMPELSIPDGEAFVSSLEEESSHAASMEVTQVLEEVSDDPLPRLTAEQIPNIEIPQVIIEADEEE